MKRLQCKFCNRYGVGEDGLVISKKVQENCSLPGVGVVSSARIYTVKCSRCHREWVYHKKIK